MNSIEFDITDQLNTFNKLSDSMAFIVSKSINDLAYEKGRKSLSIHLSDKLNIKNKVVARTAAIKVNRSNKKNLKVGLFYRLGNNPNSNINKWMGLQQYGGTETTSGGKLAIPLRDNFARYAGVPQCLGVHGLYPRERKNELQHAQLGERRHCDAVGWHV